MVRQTRAAENVITAGAKGVLAHSHGTHHKTPSEQWWTFATRQRQWPICAAAPLHQGPAATSSARCRLSESARRSCTYAIRLEFESTRSTEMPIKKRKRENLNYDLHIHKWPEIWSTFELNFTNYNPNHLTRFRPLSKDSIQMREVRSNLVPFKKDLLCTVHRLNKKRTEESPSREWATYHMRGLPVLLS